MLHFIMLFLCISCSVQEPIVVWDYFMPKSGHTFDTNDAIIRIINLDDSSDLCLSNTATAIWGSDDCVFLEEQRDTTLEDCGFNSISLAWDQGEEQASANYMIQSPDCEESCDPVQPWANDELVRAFSDWQDSVRCMMNNCETPGGIGNWDAECDSGNVFWSVQLDGLSAKSDMTFSRCEQSVQIEVHDSINDPNWENPEAMITQSIRLIVDGVFSQQTDFGGNGFERGTVQIEGDFTGSLTSQIEIINKQRGDGSFLSGCTQNSIEGEICAPGGANIQYDYPDWSCYGDICPKAEAGDCEEPDVDQDGIPDSEDNCPDTPNTNQNDQNNNGIGDACDEKEDFVLIQFKVGSRCLKAKIDGSVESVGECDREDPYQKWAFTETNRLWSFQNIGTNQCLSQSGNSIGPWQAITEPCQESNKQIWAVEEYDQGGLDNRFPHRLHNQDKDFCLYTDLTSLVYGTIWNCSLAGTQNNRKVGLYIDGDFDADPWDE